MFNKKRQKAGEYMAKDNKGKVIIKGDKITIKAKGITVTGRVISVEWNGVEDGWYIELTEANVPGGYSYWKQGIDGGDIV